MDNSFTEEKKGLTMNSFAEEVKESGFRYAFLQTLKRAGFVALITVGVLGVYCLLILLMMEAKVFTPPHYEPSSISCNYKNSSN